MRSGDEIPKVRIHYVCIPVISVDSVLKVDKKIIHKFISNNASTK